MVADKALQTMYSSLTQKLWQNTNYKQLGGMNNWLYAVITIFTQPFSICQMQTRRHLTPATEDKSGMVSKICNRQQNV